MNKADFIKDVAQRCEMSQKDVNTVLDAFQDALLEDVFAKEEEVRLKIGRFYGKTTPARAPRKGRNPRTGEVIEIGGVPEKSGQPAIKWSKIAKE